MKRDQLERQIGMRLEEFLLPNSGAPKDLRGVALVLGALPLHTDKTSCIAMRRDGTLVSYQWADDHRLSTDVDPKARLMALVLGSEKYPELRELIPPKPADARKCPACDGTGLPLSDEELDEVRCGTCCGLGYVPTPFVNGEASRA